MKVFIKGKGEIELDKSSFIAMGGEGEIYAKGNTAYKIYIDPKKMIPTGKIQELSTLTNSNIIKPNDIILNTKNNPIGYTMRYVKDTYSLCQLFTKAFRDRNNISPDNMLALVRYLQDLVKHVHQNNILIVDLNELNFMVDKQFKEIFAIDVDSYQTKSFHATALMESVRDRHCKTFNENTDWFSFAIVSFMMFSSIHPYKGKHKTIKSLEERMIKNISVFNTDVSVPSVCYPFDVIPQVYRNWYQAVFDTGLRASPPNDLNAVINLITKITQVIGSNSIDLKELKDFNESILDIIYGTINVTLTSSNIYMNANDYIPTPSSNIRIAIAPKTNAIIAAYINLNTLKLYNASKRADLNLTLSASEIMEYDHRIYCKSLGNIVEVQFTEIGQNIIPSSKIVGTCLEQSSHLFDGVMVQNLLGSYYVSLFPKSGTCYQLQIKEFNSYKIIDAKFDNNVLMVVGIKNGKYDKFIIRFSSEYDSYDVKMMNDISDLGFNFVVLDNGVVIHIVEDEKLEIFSNKKDSVNIKEVNDSVIKSDMKLFKDGMKVLFARGTKLYSMKMK